MQILKHPTFEGVERNVADDQVDRWLAAGWKHLLNEKQRDQYDEIEAEVESVPVTDEVVFESPRDKRKRDRDHA